MMQPGLSAQAVDTLIIPSSAPQGLFSFASTITVGGSTSTRSVPITVVPKSAAEAVTVENIFAADTTGVPRAGFVPGAAVRLYVWRTSTFPTTVAATVRYTVTGPDSSSILDQPLNANLSTGGSLGSTTLTLSTNAASGTYTFQATITYQDNNSATKTSTLSTTFTVSATPGALKETVTALHPYVADINLVSRTSFSPGEPVLFISVAYTTFTASASGTMRYQVSGPPGALFDSTYTSNFIPGMNVGLVAVSTSPNLPVGKYALTTTATAQALTSTNNISFDFAGAAAPTFTFLVRPGWEKTFAVDDGLESFKNNK
jgi:hypothetical protein